MKPTMTQIRSAVCKFRGGWEGAPDADLLRLWATLNDETRAQYLAGVVERPGKQKPSEGPATSAPAKGE